MSGLNLLVAVYGVALIVLGVVGSIRGQELYSLSGAVVGLLVLGCLAIVNTRPRLSRIATAVLAILIAGRFGPKFFKEGQWYPAGILFIASIVVAAALILGHLLASAKKKNVTPTGE